MGYTTDTAFAKQYDDVCRIIVQQMDSRFRDKTDLRRFNRGEELFVDYVGKSVPEARLTLNEPITPKNPPHSRIRITTAPYDDNVYISQQEMSRMVIEPRSKYMDMLRYGFFRKQDKIIAEAAIGNMYTGKTGTTVVPLPSGQKIANGGVGLTADKLKDTLKIFNGNDVPPFWKKVFAIGARQLRDMQDEPEFTDADYNVLRPLQNGEAVDFLGFTFVMFNDLVLASTIRSCFAWAQPGIALAICNDITDKVTQDTTRRGHPWQLYMEMDLGATRTENELVVQVDCKE